MSEELKNPICPYCKTEMYLTEIASGNSDGEYFEQIIWECDCTDMDLELKFKQLKDNK